MTTYEKPEDRVNARMVADAYCASWPGTGWTEMPLGCLYDFEITRPEESFDTIALLEVKRRLVTSNAYRDCSIDAAKWRELAALSRRWNIPAWFIAHYSDRALIVKVEGGEHFEVTMGGRRDRGDPRDIKPQIHIPFDRFTNQPGLPGHGQKKGRWS